MEDKADEHIPTPTLLIYRGIAEDLKHRENQTDINRASSATLCPKRRWYQRKGFKGTPLTPRKISNFMQGDLGEMTVVHFISRYLVGPGKLYFEVDFGEVKGKFTIQNGLEIIQYAQPDLKIDVGGISVVGHADGWGKRNSDGKWELIEDKTAADYGYDQFKESGAGDYLRQSHVLMACDVGLSRKVRQVRFFFLKKNTGHLWDRLHDFDEDVWRQTVAEYKTAMQEAEPEAPFKLVPEMARKKPTGRMIASFPCSYCCYVSECHKGIQMGFKDDWGGGKTPVFFK